MGFPIIRLVFSPLDHLLHSPTSSVFKNSSSLMGFQQSVVRRERDAWRYLCSSKEWVARYWCVAGRITLSFCLFPPFLHNFRWWYGPRPGMSAILCTPIFALYFTTSPYSFPPCQVPSPDRPSLLHTNYTLNNADGCKGRVATGDGTDRWCMALLDVEKPLESWNVLETTGKVQWIYQNFFQLLSLLG